MKFAIFGNSAKSDRAAQTEAQARLVRLETVSTPLEFMAAYQAAKSTGDTALHKAMKASHSYQSLCGQARLSPLRIVFEARHAKLYSVDGSARRRLMVAFTGASHRLMMPLPIFMQALPQDADLLVLVDPARNHYRHDIFDGTLGLFDLPSALGHIIGSYDDCIAFGTSGGGLPAVRFARLAGLRRGLSFGGRHIDDTLRIFRRDLLPAAFDPLCGCGRVGKTEALFLYSSENPADAETAEICKHIANGTVIPFHGHNHHSVLWLIHRLGGLETFLDHAFSQSVEEIAKFTQNLSRNGPSLG